jgi:hypothetical protein
MTVKHKETDLFQPIKDYFLNRDCEVYSEVMAGSYGSRADVVVKQGPAIGVIEMKTSLNMDVLEQAYRWLHYAHFVYVAVPLGRSHHINDYLRHCMVRDGIGLLYVDFRDDYYIKEPTIHEPIHPKFNRKIKNMWNKWITEEHKNTLPGGSYGGGYITPYKQTIKRVQQYLKRRSYAVTLNELAECVPTHYMNVKAGLFRALTVIETDWCESYLNEDGKRCFRIKEGAKI